MNKVKFFQHFILFVVLLFLIDNIALADTIDKKVTFIYIPGILSVNPEKTENDVKTLHGHFANKKLGEYIISPEYKIAGWGQIPREGYTYELFQDGLIYINTRHNKSTSKKTSETKLYLLLNPIYRFLLLGDSGSSANAVYWRNYLHNHLYDIVWYFLNENNKKEIFSIIQEKINESEGDFVLVGNSFGVIAALDFVLNNIIPDNQTNKFNQEKFAGLITTADGSNTVFAPVWFNQVCHEDYQYTENNFIRYFVENDKFWISLNHRSDILSTGIAPIITSYNGKGDGFIASEINQTGPLKNFILAFRFWDRSDSLLQSHNWCFHKPKEFTSEILRIYKENYGINSH